MHRFLILVLAASPLAAQLKLKPAEPLREPNLERSTQQDDKEQTRKVRPAILKLKPAGDPVTYVDEVDPSSEVPRTFRVPKVEAVSRDGEGVALQGYDPISYFDRQPAKGKAEVALERDGVTWHFVSEEHRKRFQQDPATYIPQYGGFCAYSIGKGYPATADPTAYAIESGKVYLFYNKLARDVWEQSRVEMTTRADRNWPRLHK